MESKYPSKVMLIRLNVASHSRLELTMKQVNLLTFDVPIFDFTWWTRDIPLRRAINDVGLGNSGVHNALELVACEFNLR